jgi:hypothetical protein
MKIQTKDLTQGNILKEGIVHSITYHKGILGAWMHHSKFDSSGGIFFAQKELNGIELRESVLFTIEGLEQITPFDFVYEEHIKLSLEDGNWWSISFDVYFKGKYLTCIKYLHEFENLIKFIKYPEIKIAVLSNDNINTLT